jgi:hypothetical protein
MAALSGRIDWRGSTMIILRVLSQEGISLFREYLHSLKEHADLPRPQFDSPPYSSPFGGHALIDEAKGFSTRLEIGKYLSEVFEHATLKRTDVIENYGLWTWLAYVWFDVICPPVNGRRKIRETARYICSSDYRDYYRHYIAGAYDIYTIHGRENSRLFLDCPPHVHNDYVEQLASRQYIISNPRLVELAHHLYWDLRGNKPKLGATDRKKPGNQRRLVKVIGQLELTYDIHTMPPKKMMALLPLEFKPWTV